VSDESSRAERDRLLKQLSDLEHRDADLSGEVQLIEKELAEVRKQISYYGTLNREMKRDVLKEPHRPFLDMSRSLR
jgi:predicted  nucleic acid-binding Zn-ribbon protein